MRLFGILLFFIVRDVLKSGRIFILVVCSLAAASVAIIMTSGILLGFQNMLTDGNRGWLADIVVTSKNDATPSLRNATAYAEIIETLPEVTATSIRTYASAVVTYDERSVQPFRIMGIDVLDEQETTVLGERVIDGSFLDHDKNPDEVVLGLTVADFLIGGPYDGSRPAIGEHIEIYAADGTLKRYRIRGIIDGKTFLPNLLVIFQKEELERLGIADTDAEIVVRTDGSIPLSDTIREIRKLNPDARVRTSEEEAGFVGDVVATVEFITSAIRLLLIASIFLIVNVIFYISVTQKRRQIGIMKSMGAPNHFIVSIYLLEAALYAVLSFILGLAIFMILLAYSRANPTPVLIGDFVLAISQRDVLIAAAIIGIASLGGSLIPSYIAARTRIIDVLRNTI